MKTRDMQWNYHALQVEIQQLEAVLPTLDGQMYAQQEQRLKDLRVEKAEMLTTMLTTMEKRERAAEKAQQTKRRRKYWREGDDRLYPLTVFYRLRDPLTQETRYYGRTTNTWLRLQQHVEDARSWLSDKTTTSNPYKREWIAALLEQGREPLLEEIAYRAWRVEHCERAEFYFICRGIQEGDPLTNYIACAPRHQPFRDALANLPPIRADFANFVGNFNSHYGQLISLLGKDLRELI